MTDANKKIGRQIRMYHGLIGTDEYPEGRYITPLCLSCNAQRGQQIPVKKNSKVFKELGAKIVDED